MQLNTKKELYSLAFRFKREKLWERLQDRQVFAVALPGGEIGYCSVMGQLGLQLGIALYIGKDQFSRYWNIYEQGSLGVPEILASLATHEMAGLNLTFDDEEYVTEEEMREAKYWAKKLHCSLTRPYPYPELVIRAPMSHLIPLTEEEDAQKLMIALRAASYIRERLIDLEYSYGLVPPAMIPTQNVPLLTPDPSAEGGFRMTETELPGYEPIHYPVPHPLDEITVIRLKGCRVCREWDIGITCLATTIIEERGPYFMPLCVNVYEPESRSFPPVTALGDNANEPDKFLMEFVNKVVSLGRRPARFRILRHDTRTRAFLTPLSRQLGIPIEEKDSLPDLAHVMEEYMNRMQENSEEIDKLVKTLCDVILKADIKKLRNAPTEFQILAKGVLSDPDRKIPDAVSRKIRSCLPYWS